MATGGCESDDEYHALKEEIPVIDATSPKTDGRLLVKDDLISQKENFKAEHNSGSVNSNSEEKKTEGESCDLFGEVNHLPRDQRFDCFLCENDGKEVTASTYCKDCYMYMCPTCLDNKHNIFPVNRRHVSVDVNKLSSDAPVTPATSFPTRTCDFHPGVFISFYCEDHDIACCIACQTQTHRDCSIQDLPDAAKFVHQLDKSSVIGDLQAVIEELGNKLKGRQNDKQRIQGEKQRILNSIDNYQQQINKMLDKLKRTSVIEIDGKEEIIQMELDSQIHNLNQEKSKAGEILSHLETTSGDNESELFTDIKLGKEFVSEIEHRLPSNKLVPAFSHMDFSVNNNIKDKLKGFESFGKLHLYKSVQINKPSKGSDGCYIVDLCQLRDGAILIIFRNIFTLTLEKRDSSYRLTDCLELGGDMFRCICAVYPDKAALLSHGSIQIVSTIDGLTLEKEILIQLSPFSDTQCGLTYTEGLFYVVSNKLIGRFSLTDSKEISRRPKTFWPNYRNDYPCCTDGQFLYISDSGKGIIKLDLQGHKLATVSKSATLVNPRGLCVDNKGRVFVCDSSENSVVMLNMKKYVAPLVVLDKSDGLKNPQTVCYNKVNHKLLVGCEKSNELKVYDLPW